MTVTAAMDATATVRSKVGVWGRRWLVGGGGGGWVNGKEGRGGVWSGRDGECCLGHSAAVMVQL